MQYLVEKDLVDFDFSNQARENAKLLTAKQLDEFEENLSDFFKDTPTETDIDDLFKYNFDEICESIGLKYTDDLEVIDDLEGWVRDTVEDNRGKDVVENYLNDFVFGLIKINFESKREILKAFDEYVDENYIEHAEDALKDEFPEVDESARYAFAREEWVKDLSDEKNFETFKIDQGV